MVLSLKSCWTSLRRPIELLPEDLQKTYWISLKKPAGFLTEKIKVFSKTSRLPFLENQFAFSQKTCFFFSLRKSFCLLSEDLFFLLYQHQLVFPLKACRFLSSNICCSYPRSPSLLSLSLTLKNIGILSEDLLVFSKKTWSFSHRRPVGLLFKELLGFPKNLLEKMKIFSKKKTCWSSLRRPVYLHPGDLLFFSL